MNRNQPGILFADLCWRCVLVVPFTQRENVFMGILSRSAKYVVERYDRAMLPVKMAGNTGEFAYSVLYPALFCCE